MVGSAEKPGFLVDLLVITKDFGEKPGF